jgi:hypothetical protein
MPDSATIASYATAGGTLVLSAVRSSSRSARIAEEGLLASLQPLLVTSLTTDPVQKLLWSDLHHAQLEGGRAVFEYENDVIYLALGMRNVGAGIALLHGWYPIPDRALVEMPHAEPEDFRLLGADMYIPAGGPGFFESAVRDADDPVRDGLLSAMAERRPFTVDVLYGDQHGRQRTISRFAVLPADGAGWFCRASLHWNLDGPEPRQRRA